MIGIFINSGHSIANYLFFLYICVAPRDLQIDLMKVFSLKPHIFNYVTQIFAACTADAGIGPGSRLFPCEGG